MNGFTFSPSYFKGPPRLHKKIKLTRGWIPILPLILVALSLVLFLLAFLSMRDPDVSLRETSRAFRSTPVFSMVVYVREEKEKEPGRFDCWIERGGRVVVKYENRFYLASEGGIPGKGDDDPDQMAGAVPEPLFLAGIFSGKRDLSLEDILWASSSRYIDIPGKMKLGNFGNGDDDHVFLKADVDGAKLHLWVRRDNQLPLRICMMEGGGGRSVDIHFCYSRDRVEAFLHSKETMAVDEKSLSLPGEWHFTQDRIGSLEPIPVPKGLNLFMTSKGGVIFEPLYRGRTFPPDCRKECFWLMGDDLGRVYYNVFPPDRDMKMFVPGDYPFDTRTPGLIEIRYCLPSLEPGKNHRVIRKFCFSEWKKGKSSSILNHSNMESPSILLRLAECHLGAADWERLDRLLSLLPEDPGDDYVRSRRDQLRLILLAGMGRYREAVLMGRDLSLELGGSLESGDWIETGVLENHLLSLVLTGELKKAREVFDETGKHALSLGWDDMDPKQEHLLLKTSVRARIPPEEMYRRMGMERRTERDDEGFVPWLNRCRKNICFF